MCSTVLCTKEQRAAARDHDATACSSCVRVQHCNPLLQSRTRRRFWLARALRTSAASDRGARTPTRPPPPLLRFYAPLQPQAQAGWPSSVQSKAQLQQQPVPGQWCGEVRVQLHPPQSLGQQPRPLPVAAALILRLLSGYRQTVSSLDTVSSPRYVYAGGWPKTWQQDSRVSEVWLAAGSRKLEAGVG